MEPGPGEPKCQGTVYGNRIPLYGHIPVNSSFCLLLSLISGSSVEKKDRSSIAIPKAVSEKVSLHDKVGPVNSS
jgi:hypothetical protein